MLRRSFYLTALIAAMTVLIATLVNSQPLPPPAEQVKPQTISEPSANAVMPVCYIQLENGQLRDLRRLCGKKSTNLVPSRSVQRPISQPNPDVDDDDSTPTSTPKPQPAPTSTPSPTQAPQPTASPSPSPIGRPANVQPSPGNSSTITPSSPNPLAIPEERD